MKIHQCDIVYLSCDGIPMCYHIGIAVEENGVMCIYHNTPTITNKYGGNIVCQPVDEMLKTRKITKILSGKLNCPDVVRAYSFKNREKRWNALSFNCEDFVYDIWKCKKVSPFRNTVIATCVLLWMF